QAPIQTVKAREGDISALRRVVALPECARLRTLDLGYAYWGRQDPIPVVADAPKLSGLRSLLLRNVRVGPAVVTALSGSPHLGNLTELDLLSTELGDAGARALAESALLDRLTNLNVANNDIGPDAAAVLLSGPNCARLTHLDLSGNDQVGMAIARAFV